jgi:gluconolactonase
MKRVSIMAFLLLAAPAAAQDMPLSDVLLPGEGWQPVSGPFKSVRALASDKDGNVYVADHDGKQVLRIDKLGRTSLFTKTRAGVSALAFGKGGLYASEPDRSRVVLLEVDGTETPFISGHAARGLACTRAGDCYFTDADEGTVDLVRRLDKGRKLVRTGVGSGIGLPSGIALWPDGGTLVVADAAGKHLYAFRIKEDLSLTDKEAYYTLRVRPKEASGARGMVFDAKGRLYVASHEGVQVFDPTGRLSGVMLRPEREPVTAVAFGGAARDRLYVGCGGKVYVRKVAAKGVVPMDK